MKSKQSAPTSFFERVTLDKEAQLCFGAALLCLVIGLVGMTLNTLIAFSTSIDALLVVSLFYGLLGTVRVTQLRKEVTAAEILNNIVAPDAEDRDNIKSAA